MNLSLADPFSLSQDYPEVFSHHLHYGHSYSVVFNRRGDLLASGRIDGTVVIFDVETGSLARIMRGHTRAVQTVSWSHCGRYLLSSSLDCKCILWDLEDGSRKRIIRFEAAVYCADLHPHRTDLFAAAVHEDFPWLLDISGPKTQRTQLSSIPRRDDPDPDSKASLAEAKTITTSTIFDSTGNFLICTNTRGWVNLISLTTNTTIFSSRLTKSSILTTRLSLSGRELIFNSRDRILRTVHMPVITSQDVSELAAGSTELEIPFDVTHTYQDLVNRLSWNHCDISPTGEYICASTYMNHDVYIWETNHGSLVKILEGPKEELGFVDWHPTRPMITASGLETGRIYIWSTNNPQRWSALAPDFVEVEENVEYVEREDEFDWRDRAVVARERRDREDEEVDLVGWGETRRESGWTMPVLLDIEESSDDDDVKIVGPTAATSQKKKKKGAGDGDKEVNGGANGATKGKKRKAEGD